MAHPCLFPVCCNNLNITNVDLLIGAVANNFWGKDDAGVQPLLERMHNAKVTSDELKSFYNSQFNTM